MGISIKLLFRVNSLKQYTTQGIPRKNTSEGTLYYRSRESKEQSTTEGIQRNTTLQRELQETLHYIKGNSKGISGKGNFKKGIDMLRSRSNSVSVVQIGISFLESKFDDLFKKSHSKGINHTISNHISLRVLELPFWSSRF